LCYLISFLDTIETYSVLGGRTTKSKRLVYDFTNKDRKEKAAKEKRKQA